MPTYTVPPGAVTRFLTRQLAVLLLLFIVIFFAGFRLFLGMTWFGMVIMAPLLAGIWIFAVRRATRQQEALLGSLVIVIDDDTIVRRLDGKPELSVRRSEITRIQEMSGHGLAVRTRDRANVVAVPTYIHGYDELRNTLASWQPIKKARVHLVLLGAISATATVVLIGTFISSNNASTVLVAGILLSLLHVLSGVVMQRQAQIDRRMKLLYWVNVPIVLALIAARVYFALR